MEIDMYVLCLLRFEDDKIVFTKRELGLAGKEIKEYLGRRRFLENLYVLRLLRFEDDKIVPTRKELGLAGKEIKEYLGRRRFLKDPVEKEGWYVYDLPRGKFLQWVSEKITIDTAQLGYYHHRVMVYFRVNFEGDFSKLRMVRGELKRIADCIIERCVKDTINGLVRSGKITYKGEIVFFYTYPLIFIRDIMKESKEFPFSEETGTLCFEIIEPSWIWPFGKRYLVRISIPATTLQRQEGRVEGSIRDIRNLFHFLFTEDVSGYDNTKISRSLLRDMTNAVYQHCLYEKKLADIRTGKFENIMDESLLVNLWTHILDTMGGRSADVHSTRIAHISYFIALLAFFVAILALLV